MNTQQAHIAQQHPKTFSKPYFYGHEALRQNLKQGMRFIAVGLVNTAIDFAVLNALIFAFGLEREGLLFIIFKSTAFLVAATNSFILNKHWVFEEKSAKSGRGLRSQMYKFLSVSAVSMLVNILIASIAFTIGHSINPGLSSQVIANISALAGTVAVFLSNFFGYKLLVFKK